MVTATIPLEQQFVLEDVDWPFYETVLEQVGDRHIFVTYDAGRLELMAPSFRHDKRARSIGLLINVLAEELEIALQGGGTTTFRRKDLKKGLEPDQCFYVKNVECIKDKDEIDLSIDPPPDLAIEVEVSRRMIPRMPVYESLGVPELWRDDGLHVHMYEIGPDGHYRSIKRSLSFPMISPEQIDHLLEMVVGIDEMNWMRLVRRWVRDNLCK